MSQPNSFNRNSVTQQILTTDGQVEQLPIGALILPPPVGLQAVAVCGGVAGGLCLWEGIFNELGVGLTICLGAIVHLFALRLLWVWVNS